MIKNKVSYPFQSMCGRPERTKKWLLFPLSVLFHGVVVAIVIIQPLLNADRELPEIHYVSLISMQQPPAVLPPVTSGGKRSGKPKTARANDKPKPKPEELLKVNRFVAPVEIPQDIQDEELFGRNEGYGDGVEGAADIPGLEIADANGVRGLIGGGEEEGGLERLSVVKTPRLIKKIDPQYPNAARISRTQGVVIIEAVTDVYGNVIKARVVQGNPLLRNAALEAVRKWVYEPYIINGIPKPVTFYAHVVFELN